MTHRYLYELLLEGEFEIEDLHGGIEWGVEVLRATKGPVGDYPVDDIDPEMGGNGLFNVAAKMVGENSEINSAREGAGS